DRKGHTTVFVTQDQEEALELADRVVVMSQGCIKKVGMPDEIYDRPLLPFVFSFIGDSRSLMVYVEAVQVWLEDCQIGIPAGEVADGAATLYFRPHDVELLHGCGGCLAGTVVSSRRVAGARRIDLSMGAGDVIAEIEVPADHPSLAKGRIAFRPTRWRIFPARADAAPATGSASSGAALPRLALTGS